MLSIWIVHRQTHQRAALARIAGTGDCTVLGAPGDKIFESAAPPNAVVLGLCGDFERELDFVHRASPRLTECAWIVIPPAGDLAEARRLFDTVPAEFLRFPPSPTVLRNALRGGLQHRRTSPLSRRNARDALESRFRRWFAGHELPELMQALSPNLAAVPILIRGERGTGRGLLARYAHAFGGNSDEPFHQVVCKEARSPSDLLRQLAEGTQPGRGGPQSVWLEDVDALPLALQHKLRDWVEFGLPEGSLRSGSVRWIATAGDETTPLWDLDNGDEDLSLLDPRLAQMLSGISVRTPPLREDLGSLEAFVAGTALAWSQQRQEGLRQFSAEALQLLREYPWPGNLLELEAVVLRTLSQCTANPILSEHLRFEGMEASSELGLRAEVEQRLPEAELVTEPAAEDAWREAEAEDEVDLESEEELAALEVLELPVAEMPAAEAEMPAAEAEMPAAEAEIPARPVVRQSILASEDEEGGLPWPRLVHAVTHEIRNPLVSIRTFAELLPERYDDPEFRARFSELVGEDLRRIDEVVCQLQSLVALPDAKPEAVDVATLLDSLLEDRRDEIQARRLLVLKELDRNQPFALGDPLQLRAALSGLLTKALCLAPDHGDVYLASKYHAAGLRGQPAMRVLLRCHHHLPQDPSRSADGIEIEGMSLGEASLEVVMAEKVVEAQGGTLTVNTGDGHETVIVIDLPAPGVDTSEPRRSAV